MDQQQLVTSVATLDLDRYCGVWFEIGRLPLRWEAAESTDITAEYTLEADGSVRVDNRCFDKAGAPSQAIGRATPVSGKPGQLEVSFLPEILRWLPFTKGDYWVLKIDELYTVALVGTPDRKNLWLLAREPRIAPAVEADYLAEATRQGFDLKPWITPAQSGRRVTDDLLKA
jgi:apolipoprotein D and lipocalin family protein